MAFTARTETYVNVSSLTTPFNFTLTKPTNTAEGDILFCLICANGTSLAVDAVPDGWTLIAEANPAVGYYYWLYYKVAGGSEPANYTWSLNATAKVRAVCSCYTGGDFDPADPILVSSNTGYVVSNNQVIAAGMNVTRTLCPMVFWAAAYYTPSAVSFTKPTTPVDAWIEDDDTGHSTPDFYTEICSMIWGSSGATGDMAATASLNPTTKHAFAVALRSPHVFTVTTADPSGVAYPDATLNGTNTCEEDILERGFDWGATTEYGDSWTETGTFAPGAFSHEISVASQGIYHYRAKSRDSTGWRYGADRMIALYPSITGYGQINLLDDESISSYAARQSWPCQVSTSMIAVAFNAYQAGGGGYHKTVVKTQNVDASGNLTDTGYSIELEDTDDEVTSPCMIKLAQANDLYALVHELAGGAGKLSILRIDGAGAIIRLHEWTFATANVCCPRIQEAFGDIVVILSRNDSGNKGTFYSCYVNHNTGVITVTGYTLDIADYYRPGDLIWHSDLPTGEYIIVSYRGNDNAGYIRTYTLNPFGQLFATGYSIQIDSGDPAGNFSGGGLVKLGNYYVCVYTKVSAPYIGRAKTFGVSSATGEITYTGNSYDWGVPNAELPDHAAAYGEYNAFLGIYVVGVPYVGAYNKGYIVALFVTTAGEISTADEEEFYGTAITEPRLILITGTSGGGGGGGDVSKIWLIIHLDMFVPTISDPEAVEVDGTQQTKQIVIVMPVPVITQGREAKYEGGQSDDTALTIPALPDKTRRSALLYEKYQAGDDGESVIYDVNWVAQTFTPSANHTCNYVGLRIGRTGVGQGTITVSIKATDGAGKPTGADLASATLDADAMMNAPASMIPFLLGAGVALTASTKYAIVVRVSNGDVTRFLKWRHDGTSPTYTGGSKAYSTDGGSTWTLDTNTDFLFEEGYYV